MPPLAPPQPDPQEPQALADVIQAALAPIAQGMQEQARTLAQLLVLMQEMRAAAAPQDERIKQMQEQQKAQDAAIAKLGTDLQAGMTILLLQIEKMGRLG